MPPVGQRAGRGATLVQYAILLSVLALGTLAAVRSLGSSSQGKLQAAGAGIDSSSSGTGIVTPGGAGAGGTGSDLDSGGSGGSGGVTTSSAPSTTARGSTTTVPAATTTFPPAPAPVAPETAEPPKTTPAPKGTAWTAIATSESKRSWRSDVSGIVMGTDGEPLTGVSAGVKVTIVQEYRTRDGKPAERSWTTQGNLVKGVLSLTDSGLSTGASGGEAVTAMRYTVTDVVYYYPSNPSIRWDGETSKTRIAAP
jgi:hypothetical protein